MIAAWFAACARDEGESPAIELLEPADPDVHGARELVVSSERPCVAHVSCPGRAVQFDVPDGELDVPVLGFPPGEAVDATVEVDDDRGRTWTRTFAVPATPPPDPTPIVEKLVFEKTRIEQGWTLANLSVPDTTTSWLVVFDEDFRLIWWWRTPIDVGDVRLGPEGHLWGLASRDAWELDWSGRILRHWGPSDNGLGTWIPLEEDEGLHHELALDGAGLLSLDTTTATTDDFPADPPIVEDPEVVRFDLGGQVTARWGMAARLDTSRVRENSLDRGADGAFEWAYANGAAVDPTDGGVVVSLRHQDALVKLSADGELEWILGDHEGWSEPFQRFLLDPIGIAFAWPSHQHAPEVEDDGTVVCFDNRAADPDGIPGPSRVVGWTVDAGAHTVRQAWSFDETATGPLYSAVMGDADRQPQTGNILADYAIVASEDGLDGAAHGWGDRWVRLVEYSPQGEAVGDIRIRSDAADVPNGWKMYRADRISWPGAEEPAE